MLRSARIAENLRGLDAYRESKTLMFFATHGSEVLTEPLIERALRDGKAVVLPRVEPGTLRISAARINSMEHDLEPRAFGVREPKPGACPAVDRKHIDAVIAPGIAFDEQGNRIGYGKGCYDEWLKGFSQNRRIGICFDFQLARRLPKTKNDTPVGTIVTENRIVRAGKKESKKSKGA